MTAEDDALFRLLRTNPTHDVIPGGAHTYSKGDDQFPANAPRHIERGEGAWVWDDQDRKFLDWTMGLRSVTLGYGWKEVNEAAIVQMWKGSNFPRPSRIEMDYGRDLVEHFPVGGMVKFAKNGSTVTTAAVKLARAYTGRDLVVFCKDHPFFSYDDWFIGTTPANNGIPGEFPRLSLGFAYNDLAAVERIFAENKGRIAALIMEAATTEEPRDDFLLKVQKLCRDDGACFIIDEMITGFRWHAKGAHAYYGIQPDMVTFGKGMANGFSVAALMGRKEIMELGGLRHEKKRVFLVSTTHGAENLSLAAARATLDIYKREPVTDHIWRIGTKLMAGLEQAGRDAGVGDAFKVYGFGCNPYFCFVEADGTVSLPLRTLFLQEMIKHGVIVNFLAPPTRILKPRSK